MKILKEVLGTQTDLIGLSHKKFAAMKHYSDFCPIQWSS